jgi:hypothetical protein
LHFPWEQKKKRQQALKKQSTCTQQLCRIR